MATIHCALSGIQFKAEHFSHYFGSAESHHPIFDLPATKLLPYYESHYLAGTLSPTESYLYYLALFRSTNLVDFRTAAAIGPLTQGIIANTMQSLVLASERISSIGSEKCQSVLHLPRFIICPETRDLTPCKDWLTIWDENYKDYRTGYRTSTMVAKLSAKEESLERNIKNKLKDISSYASALADWAELAGNFPTYEVLDQNDARIPMNEYWKRIIKFCAKGEQIFTVPDIDLQDLIEHCEDEIDHGSIQAATLMALLRSASTKKYSLASLGDIDITSTYKILKPEDGVEEANMLALILSAPTEEPVEKAYPSKLAYLRAKLKYQQAVAYYKEHPEEHPSYVAPGTAPKSEEY